jgi:hypothetical protein
VFPRRLGCPPAAAALLKEKKEVVIASPEKKIVVDGDRVVVDGEAISPELWAPLISDSDFPHRPSSRRRIPVIRSIQLTPSFGSISGARRRRRGRNGRAESPAACQIQVGTS